MKCCHTTCDPDIHDGLIPEGDWFCHECRGDDIDEEDDDADDSDFSF